MLHLRIEYGLRTAKLALGRARLRRQCSQARRSNRVCYNAKSISDSTNGLIKAVRESSRSAVKCLQEMTVSKSKPSERFVLNKIFLWFIFVIN